MEEQYFCLFRKHCLQMHVDEMKPADLSYPILKELCYTNKRETFTILKVLAARVSVFKSLEIIWKGL